MFTTQQPRKMNYANKPGVLISSSSDNLDRVLHNLYSTLRYSINENYDIKDIRTQLSVIALCLENDTNKRYNISEEAAVLGKMQSCAWLYINEYVSNGINIVEKNQLNIIIIEMATLFENINEIISNPNINIDLLDVAKDLNTTTKKLKYPITFHDNVYGNHTNIDDLKKHNGKSYIRRPIAKAELVLAWLSEILYEDENIPQRNMTGEEKGFIKTIGVMFNIFLKRNETTNKAINTLVFIRLMEIVYINCVTKTQEKELYKCFYHKQSLFKYIKDFNDIRLSTENPILSKLSYMPRRISYSYDDKYIFYNPVECDINSPIYHATVSWEKCRSLITSERNFKNVVEYTAEATFDYEKYFAANSIKEAKQCNEENQKWYDNQIVIKLNDEEERENTMKSLVPLKEKIKEELDKNGYTYSDVIFSVVGDYGDYTDIVYLRF